MIEHIAILKFKSSTSKEQKDLVIHRLKDLVGKLKLSLKSRSDLIFLKEIKVLILGLPLSSKIEKI